MQSKVDFKLVNKQLPIFSTNINHYKDILNLAHEAIMEEKEKDPKSMQSNVKACYVSNYDSHLKNIKFHPLMDLVLSFCEEVSVNYFNCSGKFKIHNCWGMLYDEGDYAIKHTHFPSTYAAVVYIDVEKNSAPIIFEDQIKFIPTPGSLILFPAIIQHEVPKSYGKRIVVAMNIENDTRS